MTSAHPVILSHNQMKFHYDNDLNQSTTSDDNMYYNKPVLEIDLEKLNESDLLQHIRYFTFLLQELDLVIEEEFIDIVIFNIYIVTF